MLGIEELRSPRCWLCHGSEARMAAEARCLPDPRHLCGVGRVPAPSLFKQQEFSYSAYAFRNFCAYKHHR